MIGYKKRFGDRLRLPFPNFQPQVLSPVDDENKMLGKAREAKMGHLEAAYNLGICYHYGCGTNGELAKARQKPRRMNELPKALHDSSIAGFRPA